MLDKYCYSEGVVITVLTDKQLNMTGKPLVGSVDQDQT